MTLSKELKEANARIKAFNEKRQKELKKAKKTTKKEAIKNIHNAMVGDILCSTWGYDQTNYDFYKVTKITEKTVTLEKLNGYDKGKILSNKKTNTYMADGSSYTVKINSYSSASCELNDRQAKNAYKKASDEFDNPYRSQH